MGARLCLDWDLTHTTLLDLVQTTASPTRVMSNDRDLLESLRDLQIPVLEGDPTNPTDVGGVDNVDVVLVASRDVSRNIDMAQAAVDVHPDAILVGYLSPKHTAAERNALAATVDRMIDGAATITDAILERSTTASTMRAYRFREVLAGIDGELAVVMHDTPDPDAIASAVALVRLANHVGVDARPFYYGEIRHQSNRAFINLLNFELTQLNPGDLPPVSGGIALVDHAVPGVNDSLPADVSVDMVFDHHNPGGLIDARYVDLRESVGATSTLMYEYLWQFDIPIDTQLASGLLYGIRTDTREFSRKVTALDFEAATELWPLADQSLLDRIEHPSVAAETMTVIAESIANRVVTDSILTTCVGKIGERDALAQAADLLLQMDGIDVTLVYGVTDTAVLASARSRSGGLHIDLAAVMRDAFGRIGEAGGHEEMAGAQLSLSFLSRDGTNGEPDMEVVRSIMEDRFMEVIREHAQIDHPVQ